MTKPKQKPRRVDKHGHALGTGDKIRVVGIPPDVRQNYSDDEELKTRIVFERCLGRVFPVKAFDENRVELLVGKVMHRPAYEHSIWLEPEFVELVSKKRPVVKRAKLRRKRGRVLK